VGATLCELTPKSVSHDLHAAGVQAAIDGWIDQHFPDREVVPC
jgi:hypothetical protein